MSEHDLSVVTAQLNQAQQELASLRQMTRNMSGQMAAQKQCIDEYLNANINIRASNILLEDDVKNMRAQIAQNIERIQVLEKEKSELIAKIENPPVIE